MIVSLTTKHPEKNSKGEQDDKEGNRNVELRDVKGRQKQEEKRLQHILAIVLPVNSLITVTCASTE